MPDHAAILAALARFAETVTAKTRAPGPGEPEDQLRAPFEVLIQEVGQVLSGQEGHIVPKGEVLLPGRLGKPDYAVHVAGLLTGYVELKEPGKGADPDRYKGHDREQWGRFKALPNLIYTDGNEWGLYQSGQRVRFLRLSGDVAGDGGRAVGEGDIQAFLGLLTDFLRWEPIIPKSVKDLADLLAPLCRMLRADVKDALKDPQSPLVAIAKDWRQLLFPDADDEQFADAYAQTVTFALLLARSEGAALLDLTGAVRALAADHSLLSRALQVLTDPHAQAEISASLNLLLRVIAVVPPSALVGPRDPWLYFYEDFLAAYDPRLRKDAGAYYTPIEVVRAQVRLVDDLLTNRLGKALGFADPGVVTLDPAVGTGTYLLGVIEHALRRVHAEQGPGAVPGQATAMAGNMYGFEVMAGPFAVSELRVSRALANMGATLPRHGIGIYLTDTLESPYVPPRDVPYILRPMGDHHRKALKLKRDEPVLVCMGNPPYDRHEAATEANKARTGGWVRWGKDERGLESILRDFLAPALAGGRGRLMTGLYNLYVYFWRWALWKVFEWQEERTDREGKVLPPAREVNRPGVVSFISASSYLDGDAFCGMREHMRRLCDEIWVLDLGGEGRGTRQSDNVFAILTPVAIAVAYRGGEAQPDRPAKVRYARLDGTRGEKLKGLDAIRNFASVRWQDCPDDWQAPFRPQGKGRYFSHPLLMDLFPWQHPGVKTHRTWLIAPHKDALRRRWKGLLRTDHREEAFKENGERKIADAHRVLLTPQASALPIAKLAADAPLPPLHPYAFRSLDRQHIIADVRLMTRPRPVLWHVHGGPEHGRQVYLSTLFNHPLADGPGAMACAFVPDMHHFRGSYGGKDIVPLYRDCEARQPNILPGLLETLAGAYRRKVSPEDFLAYVYGVLAQPAFTERFAHELGTRELRVPLTKDAALFRKLRAAGARLLWLHTYGQRFVPKGKHKGQVPKGAARCVTPVPGEPESYPEKYGHDPTTRTLRVGDGAFAPVGPEVYEFEVSGLKVVQSWLGYRMKKPKGRKSSPLDEITPGCWPGEFTTELLELLWVLEATVAGYPAQAELLSAVVKGPCFRADELPPVPPEARRPPVRSPANGLFDSPEDAGE